MQIALPTLGEKSEIKFERFSHLNKLVSAFAAMIFISSSQSRQSRFMKRETAKKKNDEKISSEQGSTPIIRFVFAFAKSYAQVNVELSGVGGNRCSAKKDQKALIVI